jgi:hypothetical protein
MTVPPVGVMAGLLMSRARRYHISRSGSPPARARNPPINGEADTPPMQPVHREWRVQDMHGMRGADGRSSAGDGKLADPMFAREATTGLHRASFSVVRKDDIR